MTAHDELDLLTDYLAYLAWRVCGKDSPLPEKRSQKHFADDTLLSPSWVSMTVGRLRKKPTKNQNSWTALADYFEKTLPQAMAEATVWSTTPVAKRWRSGQYPLEVTGESMGRAEQGPLGEAARELASEKIPASEAVLRVARADKVRERGKEEWKAQLMRLSVLEGRNALPPAGEESGPDPTARPSKEAIGRDAKIRTLPARSKRPR